MAKKTICLDEKQVMKMFTDLNFLVVSLDHIGSAELSEEDRNAELYDFTVEGNVGRRLVSMRRIISTALYDVKSHRQQLAIENKLEKVKTWKVRR